jgi:tRNA (guanine37-N1)-methyltransferase
VRIDVITIFPEYLAPARISLIGRAVADGIIDLRVHDLRMWTHDRHRTVDDTPYGGGPGMVMRPEPWGEALDAVLSDAAPDTRIVVPTPSGTPYSQKWARCYADDVPGLVVACGRYEGIDERVWQHFGTRFAVDRLSIGDYVLAGGEVAALVLLESVGRLLPGVLGNEASVGDDSFATGRSGGADCRCRACCSAGTTGGSPPGEASSPGSARPTSGPIWWAVRTLRDSRVRACRLPRGGLAAAAGVGHTARTRFLPGSAAGEREFLPRTHDQ